MPSKVPVNYYFFNENFVKKKKTNEYNFILRKIIFIFNNFFYKYNILYENNHSFFYCFILLFVLFVCVICLNFYFFIGICLPPN